MKTSAIITAAGSGSRMKAPVPKPFLELGDRPLLLWAVEAFQQSRLVDEIVIVVGEADMDRTKAMVTFRDMNKVIAVVPGGAKRQESVANGLEKISADSDIVLVHDGARPFVTGELIQAIIEQVLEKGAAVPVLALHDTIKEVSAEGTIVRTLDRSMLRAVQTPQGFKTSVLRHAHQRGKEKGLCATDDAGLCESGGQGVATVPGSSENLKITTPEDFAFAQSIAERRAKAVSSPSL